MLHKCEGCRNNKCRIVKYKSNLSIKDCVCQNCIVKPICNDPCEDFEVYIDQYYYSVTKDWSKHAYLSRITVLEKVNNNYVDTGLLNIK